LKENVSFSSFSDSERKIFISRRSGEKLVASLAKLLLACPKDIFHVKKLVQKIFRIYPFPTGYKNSWPSGRKLSTGLPRQLFTCPEQLLRKNSFLRKVQNFYGFRLLSETFLA